MRTVRNSGRVLFTAIVVLFIAAFTVGLANADTSPINLDYFITRGQAYIDQEKYVEAIASFSAAIEQDQNNAVLYNQRGYAYLELKIETNPAIKVGKREKQS